MPGLKYLKCPNCAAPINRKVPLGSTYICPYCQAAIEAPASPPPQISMRPNEHSYYYDDASNRAVIYVIVASIIVIGVAGFVFNMLQQVTQETPEPPPVETRQTPPVAPSPEPRANVPEDPPSQAPADSQGELAIAKQIGDLAMKGCTKQLLSPTTVTGPQKVETKFIAKKGCVHILADTGDDGEPLTLSLKTPAKKLVDTPPASPTLHFVFCPQRSGKHPMKIAAASWDSYTVAAVECPVGESSPL